MTRASSGPVQKMRNAVCYRLMASGLYHWRLDRHAPTGLVFAAKDPWPGDPEIATELFHGTYAFAGEVHTSVGEPPWSFIDPGVNGRAGDAWTEEALSFSWLRHFTAAGGATAGRQARALIETWIETYGIWHPLAWRPDLLARRIVSWLSHSTFFLDGADPEFKARWLASVSRQFRHLTRVARHADVGERHMRALAGVVVGGLCLPGGRVHAEPARKKLLREIERQVLADGGHVSRSPSAGLALTRDLVTVRGVLATANRDTPYLLQTALDRMGPMFGLLRHGDQRLALFNGGYEESAAEIDTILGLADARGAALFNAPHSGFQRLAAGDIVVIADAGAPPPARFSGNAHAGTASFEMSIGPHRMIVNCGAGGCAPQPQGEGEGQGENIDRGEDWVAASRATAAHSTLVVDDTSSSRFRRRGRKRGQIFNGPEQVSAAREEADGSIWLDIEHDGFARKFGVLHRRRLYLENPGTDLRGEDVITKSTTGKRGTPSPSGNLPLSIHFHLHPDVRASLSQDGGSIVLRLPDGDGWKFRASGGTLSLVESVYFGERGRVRRTEQIVIAGTVEFGEAVVKWALRRIRGGG
ncbi:MAG: heparinase II/III family protein [Rhodospirillales bacterium]|nr:heparinase II/III family protein [Rhodospirillales bacterium]